MSRSHLRGSLALSLEDSGARMSRLGRSQLIHGHVLQLAELDDHLSSVTLVDVDRVIAKVLSGTRVLAAVGPFGDEDF